MVIDDLKTEDIKEELKSIGVHEFKTLLNEDHTIVPFFGGVIQSYNPPKRTKNGEGSFLLNLLLVEPSLDSKMSIVKMNIFHKKETSLPMVTQIGDIFLCTQMRDVIRIENNKKLTKTEGLKENTYVDFVGQFLGYSNSSYTTNFPMIVIIITDYTKTKTPQSYINTKFKTNLDKDYIIQCTLYDEHANGCPDLSLGDYLLIENAYCKTSRNGSLELAVRGDRSSLSKRIKIKKLNDQDDLVKELKIHQNQFESNHKRKHPDNDNGGNDEVIDLSKQKSIKRAPHKIYAKLNSNPEQWSFIDNVINSEIDQKYYLRVSVIDYKPKNIVDMLVKYCDQCEIS
ncbi:hypothetical protein BJ944DRAFT_237993 [Cunninghamella echinulata]|nr:hypothetical protein BJ944DRAFT_237993 [Cunninghamella echinulata]